MIFELVYCSIAQPGLTLEAINEILETARSFNDEHNITGCLIYHDGEFLQILEGDQSIVMELYGRIEEDERHTNVSLLSTEEKEKRSFPNWSMAFHQFDENEVAKNKFIDDFRGFSALAERETLGLDMFWTMVGHVVG
jgi:hypothetical protein